MIPANMVVLAMNQLTGMLSKIGIMLVVFYFALFGAAFQVGAASYNFPYPGMLPDNPLYLLKVARDNIVSQLVRDPTTKAFYFLLLSDKRVAAGSMLMKNKKPTVAKATFIKATDYYSAAVDLAVSEKKSGRDVGDLAAKLVVAGVSHEEILAKSYVPTARQKNLEALDRITKLLISK